MLALTPRVPALVRDVLVYADRVPALARDVVAYAPDVPVLVRDVLADTRDVPVLLRDVLAYVRDVREYVFAIRRHVQLRDIASGLLVTVPFTVPQIVDFAIQRNG